MKLDLRIETYLSLNHLIYISKIQFVLKLIYFVNEINPITIGLFFPAVYRCFTLLGSQMTHWNEPILYGKVLSWGFQKAQDHFGGWSESWAIRDQNWSIVSWKNPNFRGGKIRDWNNSYFIFYKCNQGPFFCKHPHF